MAIQSTTEEELNLKRQARRRLIGAAALTLFVVILLPIVFDSEPPAFSGNEVELRIPSKENAPAFQPAIELPALDKMASEAAAASAPVQAPVATLPAPASPPAPKTTTAQPVETKPATAKPKPEPEAKPKTESKPVAKVPAVPKSGWVLQVGAFSNAETAKNLQARLNKLGYHAYTEKAGSVVRVRVGSYPTREAAEKVQHKLEAQGLHPDVVNLG